ncbi:hypothetical protein O181_021709 [Austropuccinia psidii MF-1]|uniref:Nuclear transport factor 2 n=1 Tax=Austropuccinia psidii MF-1 TaxID=1389203 RepID=A0A9Q3CB86_9BASI|nr:hypothetical protein [Austropuccinia psidii MF-1]
MSSSNNDEWKPPSNIHGSRWEGFLMSKLNLNSSSHRRKAKCSYCQQVFNDARPHRLFMHIKDNCHQIPPKKKSKYIQDLLQDSKVSDSDDYQRALVQSPYKLPTRDSICNNALPLLHAKIEAQIMQQVINSKGMTLSIDGWTDVSGYSLYALLLLQGEHIKQFVEILDLNLKRHTAENMYEAVKTSLERKEILFGTICAIVTDCPSVMMKFQKLLTHNHPHIMKGHCVLHAFNLIAKHFITHPTIGSTVKGNKLLVNYFSYSSYWGEYLTNWADENGIKNGLEALSITHFKNPASNMPTIPVSVISVVENRDHFTSNNSLVSLLKQVVDSIGQLEKSNIDLSDIWKDFSTVYKAIKSVSLYDCFAPLKEHCLQAIQHQAQYFQADIYIIAFFLHPSFCNVAVSQKYSLKSITIMILVLAKDWKYYKEEAKLLIPQIKRYYSQHEPLGKLTNGPFPNKAIDYWLGLPDNTQCLPLKQIAITICEIVPHAAGVEGLFSIMSAIKTKYRNQMLPTTLKMMSQIKLHLTQNELKKGRNKAKQSSEVVPVPLTEYDHMCSYDFFNSPMDLETFEGVFGHADMQVTTRQDAFMETLFDFDMWDEANRQMDSADIQVVHGNISVQQTSTHESFSGTGSLREPIGAFYSGYVRGRGSRQRKTASTKPSSSKDFTLVGLLQPSSSRDIYIDTSIMSSPSEIAAQFVQFYYEKFDTDRTQLAPLYRDHSMLTFEAAEFAGTANIVKKLQELPFTKVAHQVQTLDAQPSNPGNPSLLVLVTGTLTVDEEGNSLKFSQAFHLVQDGGTYFVLNDVFRLVYG